MQFRLLFGAVFLLSGPLGAQEAPPPPIEGDLRPESGLVEPRATDLVRKMAALLAGSKGFALEAEEIYDEVPEQSPRRQLTNRRHVALRRPDRLAGDASGDALNRTIWYDGKTFSALDKEQNTWAAAEVPPTVDGALDAILERTGMVIPLADFLYTDVYDRLMSSVQRGQYLGIHEAAGVPCHHLSFEQDTIDWQIWIDAGPEPLPRKLVIAYKTEDEVPQYAVTIRKWNLKATLPDELFRFEPPPGASRIEMPTAPPDDGPAAPAAATPPPPTQEKKP
jgi:hypothetical protein